MSGIIRVTKRDTYTAISNIPLRDAQLSWEARGILAYLLSKPNDWKVRITDLIRQGPAGGTKVNRILHELEETGYLKRERKHAADGHFEWESTVYEESTIPPKPINGDPNNGEVGDISITDLRKISPDRVLSGGTKAQPPPVVAPSPKQKKPKSNGDPRTRHPAIQAFREATGKYPQKRVYDSIITALGEHPKISLLKSCWVEWSERGYSPVNIKWVTDWYRSGSVPRNGGSSKKAAKEQHFYEAGNIPEEMFLKSELSSTFTSPERKEEIKAIFRAMEGAG